MAGGNGANGGWVGLLDWMARIRVASVEAAGLALGVTTRQVQMHGKKLEDWGFVERQRMSDGGGGTMVVTPRGVREIGHEVRSGSVPRSRTSLLHGRGVSWIAAYSQVRGRPWLGPLELRDHGLEVSTYGSGLGPSRHLPDLAFDFEGERWAVEYERVTKSRDRTRRILRAFHEGYVSGRLGPVVYVCGSPVVERLIRGVAQEIDSGSGGSWLTVRSLDRIIADTRSGTS